MFEQCLEQAVRNMKILQLPTFYVDFRLRFHFRCITAQCEGSLGQWVHFIFTADITSLSGFLDTALRTSRVCVFCITNPHLAVDKHEWMISNKLEAFRRESGHAHSWCFEDDGGFIDGTSENFETFFG